MGKDIYVYISLYILSICFATTGSRMLCRLWVAGEFSWELISCGCIYIYCFVSAFFLRRTAAAGQVVEFFLCRPVLDLMKWVAWVFFGGSIPMTHSTHLVFLVH